MSLRLFLRTLVYLIITPKTRPSPRHDREWATFVDNTGQKPVWPYRGAAEYKYAPRGRPLVLQKDPNGGRGDREDEPEEGRGPVPDSESMFLALATMRAHDRCIARGPGRPGRQALGDGGAPRHARTCGRINGTRRHLLGDGHPSSGKRAVRMAADSSGPAAERPRGVDNEEVGS